MREEINDITIVGGGDAGLLTALCVRKLNPDIEIRVVDDFEAGNSGVGKSTFQAIVGILHEFLQIPEEEFVEEVKPVFKASVYFRDWCEREPFHHPFDFYNLNPSGPVPDLGERYYYLYDTVYTDPEYPTPNEALVEKGKSPFYYNEEGELDKYPHFAYHLNTGRFNSFLRELAEERDIAIENDAIEDAEIDGNYVTEIQGQRDSYVSDLYVDASGFTRVIKDRLDGNFVHFDLPLDTAFNAKHDRPLSDVIPATVVESGEYGWFWHIDTFDNRDLGYVFASEYVDDEAALAEFIDHCDGSVSEADVRKLEFDSGYYEQAWVGNCIAAGNAEGFVEPLQSTGLTTNARAAQILSVLLAGNDRTNHAGLRETYNAFVANAWESIYDFISVHYKYSSGNNRFWEDISSLETSPRTDRLIESYNQNGISISESIDFDVTHHKGNSNDLVFFTPGSFHSIMRKMGAESEFYEQNDFDVSRSVKHERNQFHQSVQNAIDDYLTTEEFYKGYVEFVAAP